jgi:hypothetical protein
MTRLVAKIFFSIFVERMFTTLVERPFTNAFDALGGTTSPLACIALATPINAPAT